MNLKAGKRMKECISQEIFSVEDRQKAFDYIVTVTKECEKIVSLVQVGSGAIGFNDERSDLDFVIALDKDESMTEVMEYMHEKISKKYNIAYYSQEESKHLQNFLLSNMLELDFGYGCYEHAAARKPAFKVIFDNTGVVEEKMVKSREWMDNVIFGDKLKKDLEKTCDLFWARLMHAAVAINRGNYLRAVGEIDYVRTLYIDLVGDRYRLESALNREMDRLPEEEKGAIISTYVTEVSPENLWVSLRNMTKLIYKELDGKDVAVTESMVNKYYEGLE